jgi:hypothetical protein
MNLSRENIQDLLKRKETELVFLNDQQIENDRVIYQLEKKIAELNQHLSESESRVELECQSKLKIEKQRNQLNLELDSLCKKLEGAFDDSASQHELNVRHQAELEKLKQNLDAANVQYQISIAQANKKNQDIIAGLMLQIELLENNKNK